MENGEKAFEYSGYSEPSTVADYLESLAQHLRNGRVHLAAGGESIDLEMAANVKVELAAKVKPDKGKGSLQLDISWKQPPATDDSLRIEAGTEGGEEAEEEKEQAEGLEISSN
jgi:amphi-Trp domain-containing protein